jgi:signal transduction histidine kinase
MRARLTLALSLLAAALIVVLALAVYALTKREMIRQLDHSLEDKLRFFRAFCRQNEGLIGFSMSKTYWERIRDREDPEFFQYRFPNGTVIKSSASLGGTDLPPIGRTGESPEYSDVILPGDRRGRCAGISFFPDDVVGTTAAKRINLVVAHDGAHIWATLGEVRRLIIGVGIGILVILGTVTGLILRAGMRPLVDLSGQIEAVPIGETGGRFRIAPPTAEIQPVVDRLNALMDRVGDAIHNERQFTSNAAHELRNPLAGILAQLELTLGDGTLSSESRQSVEMTMEIATSLQRTAENLLQLARLEAGSEQVAAEPVEIPRLLRAAWKPSFERAEAKNLRVTWQLGDTLGEFITSAELLRVAAANLFDNAVEYTPTGGLIEISGDIAPDGALRITVANSAPDLTADEVPRLFERFWRDAKNPADSHHHSGIGLSLCAKIADLLGGKITAHLEKNQFLRVQIHVPKCRAIRKEEPN